jgi:hypothetical protein
MVCAMRASATVVVLLSASAAGAAPWRLETDFDATEPTKLSLDARGELTIATAGGTATAKVAESVTRATLQAARSAGTPTVVVDATTPTGEEAIVLQPGPKGWKEIARTKVGPVGADGEYSTEVMATASGVYRFESRPGYRRCDGKPALLFAEELVGRDFRPLLKAPFEIPVGAAVLPAHADATPVALPLVFQARTASYQVGATNAGSLSIPRELDDGKLGTYWTEDLPTSAGEGEFFTFERRIGKAKAAQLRVVPGDPSSAAHMKAVNRPKRLGVVWAGGAAHVDLPDAAIDPLGTAYIADLPAPADSCVTVIVETTYGPPNGKTAIAELEVFAEGERSGGGEAMLAAVVAAGSDGEHAAAQALARRGAAGAVAIDGELGKAADDGARSRLVHALIGVKDPAAGAPLARAVSQRWVKDKDLVDAIAALGALGQTQQLRELAAQDDLAVDARIAAVHALAASDGKLVIEVAGVGPRALRRAAIDALAAVPVAVLVPAAQAATAASAAGDLWRAVTRRGHHVAGEHAAALAALAAALPAATDYERRYRLIEGIATLGDGDALHALTELLHSLPADAKTAAYEQAAARAIADEPRPEALALVLELARDRDTGVRLAALGALASANAGAWHASDEATAIDRAIGAALASDGWPEVRRRAAQVMGGRCARPDPARALESAFARDPEHAVRGEALSALVDCKAAGVADLLVKTWNDGKQPLDLRQRAIDLAAALGDRALGDRLAKDFARWRGAALESSEALALAQNAAYAIGRLDAPGAAGVLETALGDGSFPEIVSASATGLGLLGKSCPASAKKKLADLAQSDDEQIRTAATRAAAICGK